MSVPVKELIDITCPKCGSTQSEPPRVISTCCHQCGAHIALPNQRRSAPRRGSLTAKSETWQGNGKETPAGNGAAPLNEAKAARESPASISSTAEAVARSRQSGGWISNSDAAGKNEKEEGDSGRRSRLAALRQTASSPGVKCCYQCGAEQIIKEGATQTFCPACGIYIDLEDVAINERSTRPIQTFGNVTIHRGAAALGSTICCHNLYVHGELTSRVQATGSVTFWSSGSVLGEIDCDRLIVDRLSSLRFVQRVTARTIEIHGSVVGEFVSDGEVLLSRRASLAGVVAGKTFEMNLAAELLARMEFHP